MAPNDNVCAGCLDTITGKESLKCCLCKSRYDLSCINMQNKTYHLMDQDQKSTWKCPECHCKQSKTDNTNTPVRPVNNPSNANQPASNQLGSNTLLTRNISPEACNVTLRKKKSEPLSTPKNSDQYVTESTLRDIIKQELTTALKSSINELVTDQLKRIQGEIAEFKVSFGFFNEYFEDFKKRFEEKDAVINQLRVDNTNLQQSYNELATRLCIVEQNMRESNVEISGLPENKSENLVNTLQKLAKVTGTDLGDSEILQVTRVAKLNKESDRPRTVIAKLRSPRQRDSLLAAVIDFNKKHPQDKLNSLHLGIAGNQVPVFVSEHLCPTSKQLHAATRKTAKEMSYKFVWIRNGRIFVRKDVSSKSIYIRDQDSLKQIRMTDVIN